MDDDLVAVCLHAISLKFDDTGVTDAISKYTAFVTATKFDPSALNQWVSNIESTWSEWKNADTNPEHMTAVQLTREILQSDDEDWRSCALNFTTTQGDRPYTVADLMGKIVSQDKLRTAGGTLSRTVKHALKRRLISLKYALTRLATTKSSTRATDSVTRAILRTRRKLSQRRFRCSCFCA